MRVLVTGSRTWRDRGRVAAALQKVCDDYDLNFRADEYGNTMPDPRKITVVHGACPSGADMWADDWCMANFLEAERHPADWLRYGGGAGYRRNAEMVNLGADLCLAFIKDNSNGATHTAGLAERAGIKTVRYTA